MFSLLQIAFASAPCFATTHVPTVDIVPRRRESKQLPGIETSAIGNRTKTTHARHTFRLTARPSSVDPLREPCEHEPNLTVGPSLNASPGDPTTAATR